MSFRLSNQDKSSSFENSPKPWSIIKYIKFGVCPCRVPYCRFIIPCRHSYRSKVNNLVVFRANFASVTWAEEKLPGELLLAAAVKIAQRSHEETNPRRTGKTLNNG